MSGPRRLTTPRAVIFDFDLTLADSSPGFDACHRFAAATLALPPPTSDAIRRSIGTPLDIVVPRFFPALTAAEVAAYIAAYQARADEVMTPLTVMLPGAVDSVRHLDQAGLTLAIVSQKLRYRVEAVLDREEISDCFDLVLGGEDVPAFKPDPSGLLLALQRLALSSRRRHLRRRHHDRRRGRRQRRPPLRRRPHRPHHARRLRPLRHRSPSSKASAPYPPSSTSNIVDNAVRYGVA